ncbi:DUF6932 family protein [Aquibacillus salsiterrae]|uniref:Uncharacterized protein n=1 Tax=Aquibacillus salsiterrae TaxID=2950439 RepID=A0A9X3WJL4_9BACI|nr:hypothetical protein [Aquibacillus salsiterrae]MDC3418604.1 hypothetical protein [Aquibacillus salsiterrae]
MEIPDFFDDYHLPPGEHECTMKEIEQRFLNNEMRTFRWDKFIILLKRICELKLEPEVVLINGSFVTGRKEPGDVDFAALIPAETVINAKSIAIDNHDISGIELFLNLQAQGVIRDLFGAHMIVADSDFMLKQASNIFKKGLNGKLRQKDPNRDPEWVEIPEQKGILKVGKSDILNYIGGE